MARSVFIYEFVTGGGGWQLPGQPLPSGSLLLEGQAMVAAVAADFARLPETAVLSLRDARLPAAGFPGSLSRVGSSREHQRRFGQLVREADWTLLIAPEFDGILHRLSRSVESLGGRLLSPPSELVAVATDKNHTARHLAAAGVPVPDGCSWDGVASFPSGIGWPAVLKPACGAGSLDIRRLNALADLDHWNSRDTLADAGNWRVERWVRGQAASIALVRGTRQTVLLPACSQQLGDDDRCTYLGGSLPLSAELDARARSLAVRVARSLPVWRGYIGLDLVLGEDPRGDGDVVVEVNPRLTTSYVGLRQAVDCNLAGMMLDLALGRDVELPRVVEPVQFEASGRVRRAPHRTS
ncbi:MAG: ATP-grasp domain-containing protein [Pirellulaceae bacterium]|nr:ATP-grasp domain-containing protein [Pirellulaceae bacterium]